MNENKNVKIKITNFLIEFKISLNAEIYSVLFYTWKCRRTATADGEERKLKPSTPCFVKLWGHRRLGKNHCKGTSLSVT